MKISRRKLLLGVGAAGVLAGGAALVPMVRRDGKFVETKSRYHLSKVQGALPKESDAVIIGAGIQGIAGPRYQPCRTWHECHYFRKRRDWR